MSKFAKLSERARQQKPAPTESKPESPAPSPEPARDVAAPGAGVDAAPGRDGAGGGDGQKHPDNSNLPGKLPATPPAKKREAKAEAPKDVNAGLRDAPKKKTQEATNGIPKRRRNWLNPGTW